MTSPTFDDLLGHVRAGEPSAMATILSEPRIGEKLLVHGDAVDGSFGDKELDNQVVDACRELLDAERSETRAIGDLDVFIDVFPPAPELVIFGAVHVAQPLSTMAQMLGFRVTVCDARRMLATDERFPNVDRLIVAWPNEAYEQLVVGRNTWIAILTHDPKFDEPALLGALDTDARYIGAIGSRKTHRDRQERLREAGVSEEQLDRIRAPIGLDLGGQTPEEMSIAILGEIIALRHGRSGGMLRNTSGAIRSGGA